MAEREIKSGAEVVQEFIDSMERDSEVDEDTLATIKELHSANSLTKNRLTQSLAKKRKEVINND